MADVTVLSEGVRRGRKHHQCFDCYRSISPGEEHSYQTNIYDGSAYTIRQHLDCRALADQYRADAGLSAWHYDDGFPPLYDEWSDSGEFENLIDAYRGQFPHPVCRMEWGEQVAEIRMADRLAIQENTNG